jgi:hypothetical protein
MITFFRKIRRKLADNNQFLQYSRYAIGEILLVVIGILIALSINNWNEVNKTRKTELKLLNELKEDLIETKEDLLSDIVKAKLLLATTDSLYQFAMNSKWEQLKFSLDFIYETPRLFPKLSAYKSIQAYGVNIISNDSLRKLITNFYELQLERVNYGESLIIDLNEKELKQLLHDVATPIRHCEECESLFELYNGVETGYKKRYHLVQPNTKIIHLLQEKFNLVQGLLDSRYNHTQKHIENMLNLINQELNN